MAPGNKWRLFLGNLTPETTESDVRKVLEVEDNWKVTNVDIKCKNENNYFAFADVCESRGDGDINSMIHQANQTEVKGNVFRVQLAKESFLDRLKRERENSSQSKPTKEKSGFSPSQSPRKKFNDELEVVTTKEKTKFDIKKVNCVSGSESDSEDDNFRCGFPKFRGLGAYKHLSSNQDTNSSEPPTSKGIDGSGNNNSLLNNRLRNDDSSGPVSGSSDGKDLSREERFRRIAGYNGETSIMKNHNNDGNSISPKSFTQRPRHLDSEKLNSSQGVQFRKHKQHNSNLLREKSLSKLNEWKKEKSDLIKSSLARTGSVEISKSKKFDEDVPMKRSKLQLFNDDDEPNDSYDNDFAVRQQFEGKQGQQLLEFHGKWGFDDRFKIDERFKDNVEEDTSPQHQEKITQMNILNDVLGSSVVTPKGHTKRNPVSNNKKSVLINRFDPEINETPPITVDIKTDSSKDNGDVPTSPEKKHKNKKLTPEEVTSNPGENLETEKTKKLTSEPPSYKTAENLKSLFSEEKASNKGFSLLKTLGKNDIENSQNGTYSETQSSDPTSDAPRNFWETNPFKYDSSDEEEIKEPPNGEIIKTTVDKKIKSAPTSFFYRKNDPRFEGLEDYFLQKDAAEARIDYDAKRQELKSIVKAKARNAKRKDEKRTLAIKRAIRMKQRKRRKQIKLSSANAQKSGKVVS